MPTLDEVKAQIKNLGTMNWLSRWEMSKHIEALSDVLKENEVLERVVMGKPGNINPFFGLLCATNKRLILVEKKVLNVRVEDFSYDKITSINTYGTDESFRRVTISFASGNELDVRQIEKKHAEDFDDYVRARIKMSTMSMTGQSKKDKAFDSDNERKLNALERLAKLKEQGILSEAELEKEKEKIMES